MRTCVAQVGHEPEKFLARSLRPLDEASVAPFDIGARLVHPRSHDVEKLRAAVLELIPSGGTSIFDGVTFALQQLQGIPGKRALLVFSDGREGTSSASAKECGRLARALGVPVYVIVPPGGAGVGHALADIAEATGGLLLRNTPVDKLGDLADRLGEEIRNQYVLSYTRPDGAKSGDWRAVRVEVRGREAGGEGGAGISGELGRTDSESQSLKEGRSQLFEALRLFPRAAPTRPHSCVTSSGQYHRSTFDFPGTNSARSGERTLRYPDCVPRMLRIVHRATVTRLAEPFHENQERLTSESSRNQTDPEM